MVYTYPSQMFLFKLKKKTKYLQPPELFAELDALPLSAAAAAGTGASSKDW